MLKRFISLVTAVALAGSLAACGSMETTGESVSTAKAASTVAATTTPAEPATVKFLHIYPEAQKEIDQMVKLFEDKNPNIKIQQTVVPWDKVTQTLQTSFASEDAPDCSFWWMNSLGQWAQPGYLLDLTPYMTANNNEWADSFVLQDYLRFAKFDGKFMGVPFRGAGKFLMYNADLFNQNGWKEVQTLEEFEKQCDDMIAKGITPLATAGKPDAYGVETFYSLFENFNARKAKLFDDPTFLDETRMDLPAEVYINAFKKEREFFKKGYFGKDVLAVTREETWAQFASGKFAYIGVNNNELGNIKKIVNNKFQLGVTVMPTPSDMGEKYAYGDFGDGWVIWAKTKVADQSAAFLKFLGEPEAASIFAQGQGSVMARKGVEYTEPLQKKFSELLSDGLIRLTSPSYNPGDRTEKWKKNNVEFLLSDKITPEEAFAKYLDIRKKAYEDSKN